MARDYGLTANFLFFDKSGPGTKSAANNIRKVAKASDESSSAFTRLGDVAGNKLKQVAKYGAAAAAGLTVAFGVKAVRAASDLTESINAVEVTFGEAAAGIKELGEESVRTVGLSRSQFNSLAVQFSNFAQTVAGPTGDVADVMDDLTTRVADFASVMNLDVAEAATLFQSGLAGETEPLRRYGIDLSAAAVEAHALKVGISDGTGELTEQQKVMARYSLVMEQTSKTAGDFANTQGSLANQTRIARGNFEDLAASAGQALLPIGEAIMPKVNAAMEDLGAWFDANMPAIQETTAEWGRSLGELIDRIEENFPDIKQSFEDVAAAVAEEWPDIKDTFITLGDAIGRVGEVVGVMWDAFKSLPPEVQSLIASLAIVSKATGPIKVSFGATGGLLSFLGPVGITAAAGLTLYTAAVYTNAKEGRPTPASSAARPGMTTGDYSSAPFGNFFSELFTGEPIKGARELQTQVDETRESVAKLNRAMADSGAPMEQYGRNAQDAAGDVEGLSEHTSGLGEIFSRVGAGIGATAQVIGMWFGQMASDVGAKVEEMWTNVTGWFATMGSNIAAGVSATVTVIGMWFGQMASDVGAKAQEIWGNVTNWFTQTKDSAIAKVQELWLGVTTWFTGVKDSAIAKAEEMWANVTNWFTQTKDSAIAKVQELWDGASQKFEDFKNDVSGKAQEIWGNVTGWFDDLATRSGEIWQGIVDTVGEIWDGIGAKVRGPVNNLFKWLNDNLISKLNGVIGNFDADLKIGLLPTFHSGGFTGDQIYNREGLALLRNDEFVLNPQATREHRDLAEALNSGKGREYLEDVARAGAMGYGVGPVGPIGDLISQGMSALADVLSRGARAAVDFVANPVLDLLQRTFGGNWPADLTIGWARKAVDAAKDWATGQDAAAGSGYSGPIQVGNFVRPANGVVTSEYGPRWGAFHAGIDIGAPMGAAIRAIADGKAVSTTGMGWNGGYGNMVTLDHGDGLSTRYAHASALAVGIGQIVKAGQQIAAIGSTGDSTGPHLHFETRRNGVSVNPRSIMTFDQGGYLPEGMSLVQNLTGAPEPVLNQQQWDAMQQPQKVEVYLDGRVIYESLLRLKRDRGGASLGLA